MKKKQKKKSDTDVIYDHLIKVRGGINYVQAFEQYHISRLASRIYDLKQEGIEIKFKWQHWVNNRGHKYKYKQYYIE